MHQLTITVPGYVINKIAELIGLFGGKILKNEVVITGITFDAENPQLTGKLLRKIRTNLKLTQPQMCAGLGMTQSQLSMYETGYTSISPRRAKTIIQMLSSNIEVGVSDQMRSQLGISSH